MVASTNGCVPPLNWGFPSVINSFFLSNGDFQVRVQLPSLEANPNIGQFSSGTLSFKPSPLVRSFPSNSKNLIVITKLSRFSIISSTAGKLEALWPPSNDCTRTRTRTRLRKSEQGFPTWDSLRDHVVNETVPRGVPRAGVGAGGAFTSMGG